MKHMCNSDNPLFRAVAKYIDQSEHIIDGLLRRKRRLYNEALLLSLLAGHYAGWLSIMQFKYVDVNCRHCKEKYSYKNLFS